MMLQKRQSAVLLKTVANINGLSRPSSQKNIHYSFGNFLEYDPAVDEICMTFLNTLQDKGGIL